jgi:aspartyl-tRNA(Asn)/glutamyl-tRNA(Gln) amidotransferase subunit C
MAELTRQDVMDIARLARLGLSGAEIDDMQLELAAILSHMDELAGLDTSGVEPMTHAVPMALPLRPDVVAPSLSPEVATGMSADARDGFFRVPNVIKTAADAREGGDPGRGDGA